MLWAHFALCARAPARPRRTSRRGSHTPLAERRAPAHAQSGGPAQVHTPLAGRRGDSLPRRADRRGCTLPYGRRVAGRAVEGGPAGARSLTGGATPDCHGGRTGAGARSLAGGATPDCRGGRTGAGARSLTGGATPDCRGGRTGAGARSLTGGATPDCRGGRTGAGARSLAGGAEHRLPVAARASTYVRKLTINPLDKACQVSSAPGIGRGARREGEGGRFANRPYGRRQGPAFAGNDGSRRVSKRSRYGPEGGASA